LKTWEDIAPGSQPLAVYSVDPKKYQIEVRDMRSSLRVGQRSNVPFFSLSEVAELHPTAVILSSAGYTKSMTRPIPVGLLKHGKREMSALATKDSVLSGIFCVETDGGVSIFESPGTNAERGKCVEAVQAGPMLIRKGTVRPQGSTERYFRSFVAVDREGNSLIGYSSRPLALTEVACMLQGSPYEAVNALNLQGDLLGSLIVQSVGEKRKLGGVDETIASYLVVRAR